MFKFDLRNIVERCRSKLWNYVQRKIDPMCCLVGCLWVVVGGFSLIIS